MTIQQLEYIIAVDDFRHFGKAAVSCRITQPTLTMMVQKLEDELGVKIFNRNSRPIEPTEIGKVIINQARNSIFSFSRIREMAFNEMNILGGDFRLGIIPTVATCIVPYLLKSVNESDPGFNIVMEETPTTYIIENLLYDRLDGGLAATPLDNPLFEEIPIYYEKFYAYVSPKYHLYREQEIDFKVVNPHDIWLLEHIHCMRGQVLSLCEEVKDNPLRHSVKYDSGNIYTLMNIVDCNGGLTVIPEMVAMELPEEQQEHLRRIKNDKKVREISLVVNKDFVRRKMADKIVELVRRSVPKSLQNPDLKQFAIGVEYEMPQVS